MWPEAIIEGSERKLKTDKPMKKKKISAKSISVPTSEQWESTHYR